MNSDLPVELQVALTRGYDDIVLFAEQLLGMELHEGQKNFLRNAKAKVNVLVPANRWGKSVTVAIKHIHHCFYKVGIGRGNTEAHSRAKYMTANLAPHTELTQPVFKAIKDIMTSSFSITQPDGSVKNNHCHIEWFINQESIRNTPPYYIPFVNRAEILFRSTGEDKGDSVQGKSFGYISYDEGGRSDHLEYELTSNIIPRLADLNGQLDIVSTPDQKSPSILYHYELFEKGKNGEPGYFSQEGDATDNIFLLRSNPGYMEEMIELYKGDPILDQVLYGKFVFAGDSLFPNEDIVNARDDSLTDGERYKAGHHYIIGIDTAMGEDEMVYTVMDITEEPFRVVRQMSCKGNAKSPQVHVDDLIGIFNNYYRDNNVKICLETWNGESKRFYLDLPVNMKVVTKCWGSWRPPGIKALPSQGSNIARKADILIALRKLLANKSIKIPNEPTLVKQLSIYREDDSKIPTDRVISLALACWLATDGKPQNPNVEEVEAVSW